MIAPTRLARTAWLAAALLATSGASAQYDPARVQVEPPAVAARFAAPAERYDTPAFDAAQADFTGHAQMMARLQAIADRPDVRLRQVGTSG